VTKGEVYRARVHNKAQLAYNAVGMWLEDKGEMPPKVKAVPGLAENLKIQDRVADKMRELRHEHGALDLETIEARAVMKDGHVVDLQTEARNNAKNLIEDFMIAANGVSARFLAAKGFASLRRVVRSPERWDRIEAIAAKFGEELGALASHCTEAEDAANKVERQVRKSAAACILEPRIGQRFDGIVTGASEKGTWVRVFHPPVEGKIVHGGHGVDVGDKVNVKLVDVNVERGFIDFVR